MPDREPRVERSEGEIVAEVFIAGTAEAVWHEITKRDEAQGCFFNAWLTARELAPGEKMAMRDRTGAYSSVVGEILECDSPRRFAHTFRFTQYDDAECKVIYDIEEVEGGVLFRLTVVGAPPGSKTEKSMYGGAKMIVTSLRRIVERGSLAGGLRFAFALFECLGPVLLPAKCRSSGWPLPGVPDRPRSSAGRSALAVAVAWLLWGVLDNGVYALLLAVDPRSFGDQGYPVTTSGFLVLLVLRCAYSCIAGFVAAKLARDRLGATVASAVVLLLTGVLVQALTWSHYPGWFSGLFLVSIAPAALLGSAFAVMRSSGRREV